MDLEKGLFVIWIGNVLAIHEKDMNFQAILVFCERDFDNFSCSILIEMPF